MPNQRIGSGGGWADFSGVWLVGLSSSLFFGFVPVSKSAGTVFDVGSVDFLGLSSGSSGAGSARENVTLAPRSVIVKGGA
ncbi:hypothetical protein P280DRAFT_467211 [Massarina eburnea CBS 473.64]|uniref:Uncharacterized protein n=1 Tax=Massarina eburnea CBS 473.64 TaxID=1395130 RepID=A0A6A6S688_9PLEO|nr:hypothetical protein P280DRAFT_467211 [Massarina eburnea CBS 473.64]